jgi:hypothetical protein
MQPLPMQVAYCWLKYSKKRLTYLLHAADSVLGIQLVVSIFWKNDGSLPRLKMPATCPYRKPAQSSPYPILLPGNPF